MRLSRLYGMTRHIMRWVIYGVLAIIFQVAILLSGSSCLASSDPTNCDRILTADEIISWHASAEGLQHLQKHIYESRSLIHALATGIMAEEHTWLNGPPGGAKTLSAREVLKAELRSFSDTEKRTFLIQFHKLISEGVITGFPKLKSILEKGQYEIETSTSLVGERFVFAILDEIEKANPATVTSLLSVLNERKAFLGSRVVESVLLSAIATSNKNTLEFLKSFEEDRPAGEAILDRFLQKFFVPNRFRNFMKTWDLYQQVSKNEVKHETILAIHRLKQLISRVVIPEETLRDMAWLISEVDSQLTAHADETTKPSAKDDGAEEHVPASQFSIRTSKKQLPVMKASFLIDQLMNGVSVDQIRFEMKSSDLVQLASSAIYGGPGRIRRKRVQFEVFRQDDYGYDQKKAKIQVDPYTGEIFLSGSDSMTPVMLYDFDKKILKHGEWLRDEQEVERVVHAIDSLERKQIQYEDDGVIDEVLTVESLTQASRQELEKVKLERAIFIQQLNSVLNSTIKRPAYEDQKTFQMHTDLKASDLLEIKRRILMLEGISQRSESESLELAYYQSQLFYFDISKKYFERYLVILSLLTSFLSDSNVLAFGPAGGAKTELAKKILEAEIESINLTVQDQKELDDFKELFLLQFHKLVPDGVIRGFPKLQSQIDTGKVEYDIETSLIHKRFIFALLDEVEKGNPAVLTALLSVINEKEGFLGNEVIRSALRMAVMTSNKTLFEFLESFGDDRPAGEALVNRAINKVYVPNKFSTPAVLADFLVLLESKTKDASEKRLKLSLSPLRALVKKVEIPDVLGRAAAQILEAYTSKRMSEYEDSKRAHQESAVENPHVSEPATIPSIRSDLLLFDQWKASFILKQLREGVRFKDLDFKMTFADIDLLAFGTVYWGPWRIERSELNGVIFFELESHLKTMMSQPYVNQRQKNIINDIESEIESFVEITNQILQKLLIDYRDNLAQYPNLFPVPKVSNNNNSEKESK